jgi:uncharacterized protein
MSYEEQIRERMYKAPHGSTEKSLLKVLLGEVQQKSNIGQFTDEMGLAIVKKMMKANEETVPHLGETDSRRAKLLEENLVLTGLLPQYWNIGQIRERLQADGVNVQVAKNDGQAIGMAMGHLKKINAPVEGQSVKEAVAEMRKG